MASKLIIILWISLLVLLIGKAQPSGNDIDTGEASETADVSTSKSFRAEGALKKRDNVRNTAKDQSDTSANENPKVRPSKNNSRSSQLNNKIKTNEFARKRNVTNGSESKKLSSNSDNGRPEKRNQQISRKQNQPQNMADTNSSNRMKRKNISRSDHFEMKGGKRMGRPASRAAKASPESASSEESQKRTRGPEQSKVNRRGMGKKNDRSTSSESQEDPRRRGNNKGRSAKTTNKRNRRDVYRGLNASIAERRDNKRKTLQFPIKLFRRSALNKTNNTALSKYLASLIKPKVTTTTMVPGFKKSINLSNSTSGNSGTKSANISTKAKKSKTKRSANGEQQLFNNAKNRSNNRNSSVTKRTKYMSALHNIYLY